MKVIKCQIHVNKIFIGPLRFWRGWGASVAGSFPGQAAYYLSYESAQEFSKSLLQGSSQDYTFLTGFLSGKLIFTILISYPFEKGAFAEVAAGVFYVPADVVAQRLQVQSSHGFVHNSRLYTGPFGMVCL